MNSLLYFDHNATTPLAPEVLETFVAALRDFPGNASSMHRAGQSARRQLEAARHTLASALGASANEIVFTSGGTESNNLAIRGLLTPRSVHAVTSAIEHPAVLEPLRAWPQLTHVGVDANGVVDPGEIASRIRPETALVSIMHANNETGAVQPVGEIAAHVAGLRRAGQPIFFHSDGVQAFGKLPMNLRETPADLYALSAHKIHGPKGSGALFVRNNTPLAGIQLGGRQERDRRAGTEDVPGVIAFVRAAELALQSGPSQLAAFRDRFEAQLRVLDDIEIHSVRVQRLPNTSNILFRGVSGEALLIALDTAGMAVSTGSACASGSIEPSPVLLAMGRSVTEARSSVRFSFGRFNTTDEIDRLSETVIHSVKRLRTKTGIRAMSGAIGGL